jgi:NAD(P)H-dependent FMN reductase
MLPPALGQYQHEHTKAWAAKIASFDGYVFISPEYNHSTSGVLKNAIDFLYAEWHNKAAGFVSYGAVGGARAVEQLRLICANLKLATVRAQVSLSLFTDFANFTEFQPMDLQVQALNEVFPETVSWSKALASVRTAS